MASLCAKYRVWWWTGKDMASLCSKSRVWQWTGKVMAWSVFQVYSMAVDRLSYGLVCVPSLQYGSGQAKLWPGLCSKSTV